MQALAEVTDYRVQLEIFEGPLDLLLYLIKQQEIDIYDIPISDNHRPVPAVRSDDARS